MSAFEDQSGKIGSSLFREILLPKLGKSSGRVLKGPRYGVDTSVIDLGGGQGLAVTSDPLSLLPSLGLRESAWLSVHLLANDMATTGFAPQFAQFVLNLPADFGRDAFEKYWGHLHELCSQTGIAITGGHTGLVPGQQSTMPGGGTMFLTAPLDEILTADGACPGDAIIVTKESALAATSILAMSFPETVARELGMDVHERACDNFYRTSSLAEALEASKVLEPNNTLKAMHDVTEGGILGAISEMAEASGCGFRVYDEQLPVGEIPGMVAGLFEIDPRLCVGAGSMVMAVKNGSEDILLEHLAGKSIPAAAVGRFTSASEGTVIVKDGEELPFEFDGNDPYWEAFFKAMEKGLT